MGLFRITRAAITPGTQPQKVSSNTIRKEPQPLPITESGGNIIASNTLQKLIIVFFNPAYSIGTSYNYQTQEAGDCYNLGKAMLAGLHIPISRH